MRHLVFATCLLMLFAFCAGCERRIFYEWRDEPYINPVYKQGEAEAKRRMGSCYPNERTIGLRALSVIGREALLAGDNKKALEITELFIAAYMKEPSPQVRSVILAVCMRNVCAGNRMAELFLIRQLRGGERASAAWTLAAMKSSWAFVHIKDAYIREHDWGMKYEMLGSLWLLGDERGVEILQTALGQMQQPNSPWPDKIHNMEKSMCVAALRSRIVTLQAVVNYKPTNTSSK